jgi:carbonic anhydrase/acetyltransferase-like protein (isoleucine patch superfamily)
MPPNIHQSCFVHKTAVIIGSVTIHRNCGIWPISVIRADENTIEIGEGSNIQDCCVVHVSEGNPTRIGKNVSLGHGSIVHGATIGDGVIVGMNAVVLNGAKVGSGSIIGAGALVKEDSVVPECSLVVGIPGRVVRAGDENLKKYAIKNAITYQELAKRHKKGEFSDYK